MRDKLLASLRSRYVGKQFVESGVTAGTHTVTDVVDYAGASTLWLKCTFVYAGGYNATIADFVVSFPVFHESLADGSLEEMC